MPELPEVETIRRSLEKTIVGKKIKSVEVRLAKVFKGNNKEVEGRAIEAVERKGKVLIIRLSGRTCLLIHFKMTGQLVWVPKPSEPGLKPRITLGHPIPFAGSELPAKTTHVILEIDGGRLFYNDLRQFGWIRIIENSKKQIENIIGKLGPEPFSAEFTTDYLKKIFAKTSKPIKLLLMDQEKMAGIGNIYANEALFEAGIDPRKSARQLSNEAIEQLRKGILKVLEEGLRYGGSSAADEAYIKPTGEPGSYQDHFRVYQRDGQKCRRCGKAIERIKMGGRGTFFCPGCQH
jgi:formamidopyrimidine-DNA glycosylase